MFYHLLLWLCILVYAVCGFSHLFTGFVMNALDLYMKYTAEVVTLQMDIV